MLLYYHATNANPPTTQILGQVKTFGIQVRFFLEPRKRDDGAKCRPTLVILPKREEITPIRIEEFYLKMIPHLSTHWKFASSKPLL